MPANNAERVSEAVFRRWLGQQPNATTIVGVAGQPEACPLAHWLTEEFGVVAKVDYGVVIFADGRMEPAPEWMSRFQRKVDRQPDNTPINRRQALYLLTRVEQAILKGLEDDD